MKFAFTFTPAGKQINLTPENPNEALLLASLAPDNGAERENCDAELQFTWTSDRPPYKKLLNLSIVL